MLVRRAAEADLDRILSFVLHDPLGWVDSNTFRRYLASGSYSVDRMWLAEQNGHIAACAVWYGSPSDAHNLILDCLWVAPVIGDRVALAAAMLRTGPTVAPTTYRDGAAGAASAEYHLFLKPGWRDDPITSGELEWRRMAARSVGLTNELERLRYEWTPAVGLDAPSGRLLFSSEPDDDVFVDVFRQVAEGILDRGIRDEMARMGFDGHARATLACYLGMRGNRAWWRIAHTPGGQLVGFTVPSANEDGPVIGYLGVVPEMRGRRYAGDLLAEATRILAEGGAQRIRADTDVTNVPMAAAFERARYRNFSVRLILSA